MLGERTDIMRVALRVLRLLPGVVVLGVLVQRLGSGPFVAAVHALNGPTVTAALAVGAATTILSAWRWAVVAGGLGIRLPLRQAVGGYYRALFLNGVLPGGVLGDLHRAVRHGRDVGSVSLAAKAVVLERCAGQLVLVATAVAVALASPTMLLPLATSGVLDRPVWMIAGVVGVIVVLALVVVMVRFVTARRRGNSAGSGGWAVGVRTVLLARGRRARVLVASALVLVGHVATFALAAHAAGAVVPLGRLVPLALLSLLAMSVPVNIGGWGLREGMTAWAFGAAGLSAAQGLTIAVLYGLLALIASLPGAVVLVGARRVGGVERASGSPARRWPAASPGGS
jgi:uncharacterized membrane protein YbhN (UPF0104 family)